MKAEPHTHELVIQDFGWHGCLVVYGDQKKRLGFPPSERRLKRIARKLVKRHDSESGWAGERERAYAAAKQDIATFAAQRVAEASVGTHEREQS